MNPLSVGSPVPQVNPMAQGIANMLSSLKRFSSPQVFLGTLQRENPQLYQYIQQISQSIADPNQVAMQMLSQRGISPQQILSLMHR